jgi:general secretion pathway protein I
MKRRGNKERRRLALAPANHPAPRQAGFTLIEILVALAIVAIALTAGLQATSALTSNALRQSSVECQQAERSFGVAVSVLPTPNPSFRRVDAQVFDGNSPVLRLSTVVGRF